MVAGTEAAAVGADAAAGAAAAMRADAAMVGG
jgi:hypothetical protein